MFGPWLRSAAHKTELRLHGSSYPSQSRSRHQCRRITLTYTRREDLSLAQDRLWSPSPGLEHMRAGARGGSCRRRRGWRPRRRPVRSAATCRSSPVCAPALPRLPLSLKGELLGSRPEGTALGAAGGVLEDGLAPFRPHGVPLCRLSVWLKCARNRSVRCVPIVQKTYPPVP